MEIKKNNIIYQIYKLESGKKVIFVWYDETLDNIINRSEKHELSISE